MIPMAQVQFLRWRVDKSNPARHPYFFSYLSSGPPSFQSNTDAILYLDARHTYTTEGTVIVAFEKYLHL